MLKCHKSLYIGGDNLVSQRNDRNQDINGTEPEDWPTKLEKIQVKKHLLQAIAINIQVIEEKNGKLKI